MYVWREKYNFDLCDFFGELVCALVQGARHARVPVPGFTCDRSCMDPPVIETVSGTRTRGVRTRTDMVRSKTTSPIKFFAPLLLYLSMQKAQRVESVQTSLAEERIEAGVADRLIESSELREKNVYF